MGRSPRRPNPIARGVVAAFHEVGLNGDQDDQPSSGETSPLAHGQPRPAASRKELGAYYTDATVARFLLRWAVVTGRETVLDPSFGGGVFLTAAAERIRELGGDPRSQVYGIEFDAATYQALATRLPLTAPFARLLNASFFDVRPNELPAVDAVVGNPRFIRYQRFRGAMRHAALQRAHEAGVDLLSLASSWAPFLVHAVQFMKPGGRLAVVAPAELAHAAYARPVLEYLLRAFRVVRVLTFARRLFPDLSEDTVLVLAAGRGEPFDCLTLTDLQGASALADWADPTMDLPSDAPVDAGAIRQGRERLLHYVLPERTRHLYRELKASSHVIALGDLANVGIGYVTGDNDFFHLSKGTIGVFDLPDSFLRPAVRSGSELNGLRFTPKDWQSLHDSGSANLLLHVSNGQHLPDSVQAYLREGLQKGVPLRYKCRVRQPWYSVPHVYQADGFLTYMSGSVPRLVANETDAVAPNTLLNIRVYPLCRGRAPGVLGLAATWQTTLTALSCELEGHSLGGGMLKLEPTKAGHVVVGLPDIDERVLEDLASELDMLLRAGKHEAARERADAAILHSGLGLTRAEISQLRNGWLTLRTRRLRR